MPIELAAFCKDINPATTILFFGAGSSLPSGSPSSRQLVQALATRGGFDPDNLSLMEAATLVETSIDRSAMIRTLQEQFKRPNPTGGLQNLPLYAWRNIYTTNFDELIEEAYRRKSVALGVNVSNFDFATTATMAASTKLYKLHGTITQDTALGHRARMIITEEDYKANEDFRQALFDTLRLDLHTADLVVIGHSLGDEDIKAIITRALDIRQKNQGGRTISLLIYEPDVNRAKLFEAKGIKVSFGGIDEFFAVISVKAAPPASASTDEQSSDTLIPVLAPVTLEVGHAASEHAPNLSSMFNGRPASYPDIRDGHTFIRGVSPMLASHLQTPSAIALVLGASGVGKTTAARQALLQLLRNGVACWEHIDDHQLDANAWVVMGRQLAAAGINGTLLIDDAHHHLFQINDLVDRLSADGHGALRILLVTSKNHWLPRVKTAALFRHYRSFEMSKLDPGEINALLDLLERNAQVQALTDRTFLGFSRGERARRLQARCESDMFVCLKNIFASEKFDDIVLREFAELDQAPQEVYRAVAAMETAGVRVHRQLVVRMLGISADTISALLGQLEDIIQEYTIDKFKGIYGWKGRHPVITEIITQYKYDDPESYRQLLIRVVDSLVPTYEIEQRTIRELCNIDGLSRLPNRAAQNELLSRMISKAPGERVPRHRLIRNLIEDHKFEDAETEVRLFENDFGVDAPVHRYKLLLLKERALYTPGIMDEDRIALLNRAINLAAEGASRFPNHAPMLRAYADVGLELYKKTKDSASFDRAMRAMKEAESRVEDPDITRAIAQYERRVAGHELADQSVAGP